jgi:hypothetical protein
MWTALTEDHLRAYLSAPQSALVDYLNEEETTALVVIITDVTARIRGSLLAVDNVTMTLDVSLLPPELLRAASYLCIQTLQGRIPQMALADAQEAAIAESVALLDGLKEQKIALSKPDFSQQMVSVAGTRVLEARSRRLSEQKLRTF